MNAEQRRHLGILTGVRAEAAALRPMLQSGLRTTLALSAADPDQAKRQCSTLIESGVTHLLSFGFAGGLAPNLPPGTVVLPTEITLPGGMVQAVDPIWHRAAAGLLAEMQPHNGPYLAVDLAITTMAAKRKLYEATGALAVDMESHILAETGLPFLVVRAVCDPADAALPPAAAVAVRPDGGTSLSRVLLSLLRQPQQIGDLLRLARDARLAEQSLLRCCHLAGVGGVGGFGLV